MNDIWFECKTAIIIFLLMAALLISGAIIISGNHDNKLWNNGHCPACGSEWEYEQAVGHHYSTHYIYMCSECGKRIEIDEIR